jgi:hypothetical protein
MARHRSLLLFIAITLLTTFAFGQVGNVEGTVYLPGENGGVAAGATVTLRHEHNDSLTTTTNAEGHYNFTGIQHGMYTAQATLDGYMPGMGSVNVIENQTSTLNLHLGAIPTGFGVVEGLVRLPGDNGAPAAGAAVILSRMHMDSLVTTTNGEGHFHFDSVAVGEYAIRAILDGYRDAEGMVFVQDGHSTTITLHLRNPEAGGGTVNGIVMLGNGEPAHHANIELSGPELPVYHSMTNDEGHFNIEHVQAGAYTITAMLMMHGFATAPVQVTENQITSVTLTLNDSMGGGQHHHEGDTLTIVDLTGTAIVVAPDSIHHPHHIRYFLDVDNDGVPDYQLSFGPPWYNSPSGATRPQNGDVITVHGGLLTYTDPSIVVVYQINGQFWREPFHGHGGHGGGDHGHDGCNPDSVTRVELQGVAQVHNIGGFHGDQTLYMMNTDDDPMAEYRLDFGRADYDPGNGATRPADGDSIAIVGGQIYCPNMETPIVIVYEINGMFWREPGDTLGLGSVDAVSGVGPVKVGTPVSYLTARNYPNPFNPTTIISYSIPMSGEVKLAVFDITGRKVADLVNQHQDAGTYAVAFDGHTLPSGIYFYRVNVGSQSFTNRMLLLK